MGLKIKRRWPWLGLLMMALLFIGVQAVKLPLSSSGPAAKATITQELPVVGSHDRLLQLLQEYRNSSVYNYPPRIYYKQMASNEKLDKGVDQAQNIMLDSNPDYSPTNVQVEGVDEADLVKTDGKYIYQVNRKQVVIIKALDLPVPASSAGWLEKSLVDAAVELRPADSMKVVNRINFDDDNFAPAELYLAESRLTVIGTSYIDCPDMYPYSVNKKLYPRRDRSITRALVYNIADREHVVKERELELEGDYLSSRKLGSCLYLLTNRYIDYYNIEQGQDDVPVYRDTVQRGQFVSKDLTQVRYFPAGVQPNYLMIAAVDLEKPQSSANVETYLGSGEHVYASLQNLYVAVDDYQRDALIHKVKNGILDSPFQTDTRIYKFALNGNKVTYCRDGRVPGTILNQFSMDEYGDYCRIATTSGELRRDQNTSRNNVYILDKDLNIAGRLEDIAPGEKIYSTRFMGDRAYMVTFQKVDPFFVLDLKDPQNPKILGKLKIPGYSDYLHPYDENHIIGFGKDTIELKNDNGGSQAFYQGMKVAVFDVTNVAQPVEMSREIIGDRGTSSELLDNHKALLFSREKNLLAFPVTVMEIKGRNNINETGNMPEYGTFTFQGAYIYKIDLTDGLQLKAKITHLNAGDYMKAGDCWPDSDKNIERVIYIGDVLYTLSPAMIKAHYLGDMKELQTLALE